MPRLRVWPYLSGMLLFILTVSVIAQSSCPAIVNQAIEAIEDFCLDDSRNSVCYGANQVNAEFYEVCCG